MGLWSILIPLAITNLVANPSFEIGLNGYTAVNGAIARTLTKQRRGAASLQVTPAANAYAGAYYAISLAAGTQYTFSVDVLGVLGVPYKIWFADGSDNLVGAAAAFVGTGDWQRVAVTATTTGGTGYRLYVTKNNSTSVAPFYLDGFQCAASGYDVSYCDGDQTDAIWNGAAHQSTSQRGADSRAGGREIFLEDYTGLTVRTSSGLGMPPAQHLVEEQAFIPGARFAGSKVKARTLDLVIDLVSSSRDTLHSLRKLLLSSVDPEITPDEQPFILRYYGANPNKPLEIAAVYDSGLEMGETAHFQETLQMRMIAYDPWWREIGNTAAQITTSQTIAQANYVLGRVNGAWRDLDQGMAGSVYALANGTDGAMYAGGLFTVTFRGVAANKIAKWDGAAWSALGSGLNNTVWAITIGPDGSLYAGGTFTTAGGLAANYIARWNGAAWSALGTGMNGDVFAITFGPDGSLYAGGAFTTAGGVAANKIAKWDGAAWSALGTGMNNEVWATAFGPDGSLYAGGRFTTAGGSGANYIARWNGAAWSALGTGMNGEVDSIKFGPDGTLYTGGLFTTAGGITVNRIARWNGANWSALGSGMNGRVQVLAWEGGKLYAGGEFTTAGGLSLSDRVAMWNGSTWTHLDVDLPGLPIVYSILVNENNGNLYLGYDTMGSATTGYVNPITNPGSRISFPIIKINRSGGTGAIVEMLKNEISGDELRFNYPLLNGETLTIDLNADQPVVLSSFFGRVWRALLRNSDFADFCLKPGLNQISAYVANSGATVTAWMEWPVLHRSADGAAV